MGRLINVPELPAHFVPRPDILAELKARILQPRATASGITSAAHKVGLQGMGGIGKSVLAAALARDDTVRQRFTDGLIWLTLGRKPDLMARQVQLAKALGETAPQFADVQDGRAQLSTLLAQRTCLIVLDDVWDAAAITAFNVLGPASHLLITTRNAELLTGLGAQPYTLDVLPVPQARALLAAWSNQSPLPPQAEAILTECGRLPLALAMVGALLRDKPPERWDSVLNRLRKADLVRIGQSFPDYPYPNLLVALEASIEALEPWLQARYRELAVFPEAVPIPVSAVHTLWMATSGCERDEAEDNLDRLESRSLLRRDAAGWITQHALQRDYLWVQASTHLPALHQALLAGYAKQCRGSWSCGPADGYFFAHLAKHLLAAGRLAELQALLSDFTWLQAKLKATDVNTLLADYELVRHEEALQLVRGAIQLAAHVIAKDPAQFASQLLGRLDSSGPIPIPALRQQLEGWQDLPWLRPLTPTLTAPGGPLLLTLTGHTDKVRVVIAIADGWRVVSGADDGTVRVWDLDRGLLLRTLTGHTDWIRAIAVTADGSRIISAADDHTIRVWNLDTGLCERIIAIYSDWIHAVAITLDDACLVTGDDQGYITLWNLESGAKLAVVRGHTAAINAFTMTRDGSFLLSAADDRRIKVWKLPCLHEERTLRGHTARVISMAMTPDNKVISAATDDTLRSWDLTTETAQASELISDQAYWVRAVTVTPDGEQAIVASEDRTLAIWNLRTKKLEGILEGHSDWVTAVAALTDGQRVVSGSYDLTLKVWNLKRASQARSASAHTDRIRAVTLMPDDEHAITSADDSTLRIWDCHTGALQRTFSGHPHWVFVLTPDGQRIVSAASGATIKVWDLASGLEHGTFTDHSDRIRAIAVCPDGARVISAADDRSIRIWRLDSGQSLLTIPIRFTWIRSLAITPDGQYLITASEGRALKVWNLTDGAEVLTLRGHQARINTLAVSPDNQFIFSGSDDHTVRIWSLREAAEIRVLTGHTAKVNSISVGIEGRILASVADDSTVRIWRIPTGEQISAFTGESPMTACAAGSRVPLVVAGDQTGKVHFLRLQCLE